MLSQLQRLRSGFQQPLAVLRNKIEPCLTVDTAPLSADLRKVKVLLKAVPGGMLTVVTQEDF